MAPTSTELGIANKRILVLGVTVTSGLQVATTNMHQFAQSFTTATSALVRITNSEGRFQKVRVL
jgi:hypothetical protein